MKPQNTSELEEKRQVCVWVTAGQHAKLARVAESRGESSASVLRKLIEEAHENGEQ